MTKRLTDQAVARSSVAKAEGWRVVWDALAPGLGIKISATGRKIWIAQFYFPGQRTQARRTLGTFPVMTVAEARVKAGEWCALVKEGRDPAEVEAEKRRVAEVAAAAEKRAQQLRDKNTFASVAERYIAQRTNRRAKDDGRDIRRLLVSEWGPKPITEITARDVRELINKLLARRVRYDARTSWQHLSCLFQWAVHEELLEASPAASVSKRLLFKGVSFSARTRVLTDDEVFALWRAADRIGYPHGTVYKLLMLSGLRLNEVAGMAWSELDPAVLRALRTREEHEPADWSAVSPDRRLLTIAAARMKGRDTGTRPVSAHIVPLTDTMLDLLAELPRGEGDFVFSTTAGRLPSWQGHKVKARVDTLMLRTLKALARVRGDDVAAVQLEGWVNHDIRRSCRTRLARLRVDDATAEAILAHVRVGVVGIYDRHSYLDEKREALELLGQHLLSIVDPSRVPPPSNVVPLVAGARR